MQKFDDHGNRHWNWRAVQIWQILTSKAMNKQLITYGELATLLHFDGAGVLSDPLGHIMLYCYENDLPPLTCLVINQEGLPGDGLITLGDYDSIDSARIDVFTTDWFNIIPPTAEEYKTIGNVIPPNLARKV